MNYLEDEECKLSNNLAERSIRPFVVGDYSAVSGLPISISSPPVQGASPLLVLLLCIVTLEV
ncbi:transposase [Aerococcaceae bacterium DSM 109653]|uniref:Transposase n=2 Tax=Fundicoccus ignavus TaxID=2664442 RepID=A0A844BTI0_9LACT|nr:transposase [Fundicoccus ignavus]